MKSTDLKFKSMFKNFLKDDMKFKKGASFSQILTIAVPVVLVIGLIIIIFATMDRKVQSYDSDVIAMGTYIHQTVYGDNAEKITQKANKRIEQIENLISWRISGSDLSKVNSSAGFDWVNVDTLTSGILSSCIEVAKSSKGAFTPLMYALTSLWNFDEQSEVKTKVQKYNPSLIQKTSKDDISVKVVPSEVDIKNALDHVNCDFLRLNTDVHRAKITDSLAGIDLGAVGKGVVCDEIVKLYNNEHAKSGIIAAGGSVGIYGTKSGEEFWNIAIRDPFKAMDDQTGAMILKLRSGFVSTSGSYEKYFEKDGKVYHHILDPKTGYPVDNGLISVTVYHKGKGVLTDILSTACFVLGKNDSLGLLKEYGAEAVFIYKDKSVFVTDGLKSDLLIQNDEFKLVS